jgi:two-component system, LuxR family, sensor kinase FixL
LAREGVIVASDKIRCRAFISENILWDILESVYDAVITIDQDHLIQYLNHRAEAMFGYERSELLGQDLGLLLPDVQKKTHRDFLNLYLSTRTPKVLGKTLECNGQRKDGSRFPLEKSYSYHEADGHHYFTAVIRDITEKQQMEQHIRFTERLADVGKAVTHVAHEIRNPLMLIGGFAKQLERAPGIQQDPKNRQKLNIIIDEVRRMEELMEGILLLRRPASASRKRVVDANELLRETCRLLDPRLSGRQVTLDIHLADGGLPIHADPDQIKQVLLNLLQNALEAIEGPGAIVIESQKTAQTAQVVIRDSGPGVPVELRQRIFEPFFTTKTHGTGLGLAITRNIVQDHGGTIRLDCGLDRGTSVTVELPLEQGQTSALGTR